MSVYVDPLFNWGWKFGLSCHMVADSEKELHTLAKKIGLKRSWFQPKPPHRLAHYDLTVKRRKAAVLAGAIELNRYDFWLKFLAFKWVEL